MGKPKKFHITARALRDGLREGEWVKVNGQFPNPPGEWKPWRRKRLAVAIEMTRWFVLHKKDADWISHRFLQDGRVEKRVSKQRVAQYVQRGVSFLIERGIFNKAAKKRKETKA